MADKSPEQEPSIEEILASIRQIISDDDKDPQEDTAPEIVAEAPPAPVPPPKPEPKAAPAPEPVVASEPEPEEEDEVLELTEPLIEAEAIEVDMQDVKEEFTPPPVPPKAPAAAPVATESPILNERARKSAISSMAKLAGNMPINRPSHGQNSITLEDLVREMLNPMLSDWLNSNLPPMVERIVQKELEKLARQALDE